MFDSHVRFISEPGRYFAAASRILYKQECDTHNKIKIFQFLSIPDTLAVTVISKRVIKQEDNRQHPRRTSNNRRQYNYYLADGVYPPSLFIPSPTSFVVIFETI